MNLFYQKNSLKDTLIVSLYNEISTHTVNNSDYVLIYNNDKLIGINIFNLSNHINLSNGFIFPTDELIKLILKLTNINLNEYIKDNILICEVIECEIIENTHLHKCIVNIGNDKTLQIVCGASNVRSGMITVCAIDNTVLPSGKYINNGELMKIKSYGMLCSYKELNIKMDSKGIIELDPSYKTQIGSVYKLCFNNLSK